MPRYTVREDSHVPYLRSGADPRFAPSVPSCRHTALGLSRYATTEAKPQLGGENPLLQDALRVVVDCNRGGVAGRGLPSVVHHQASARSGLLAVRARVGSLPS